MKLSNVPKPRKTKQSKAFSPIVSFVRLERKWQWRGGYGKIDLRPVGMLLLSAGRQSQTNLEYFRALLKFYFLSSLGSIFDTNDNISHFTEK